MPVGHRLRERTSERPDTAASLFPLALGCGTLGAGEDDLAPAYGRETLGFGLARERLPRRGYRSQRATGRGQRRTVLAEAVAGGRPGRRGLTPQTSPATASRTVNPLPTTSRR